MKENQNIIEVKKELLDVVIDAIRFFAQHSSIVINGEEKKVSVKYKGPSGYRMSFDAVATDRQKLIEFEDNNH